MAQNVAGDAAIVESLTKVGAEIHGYEPTPSDLVRAQTADLILENGLGLERWADKFYANLPETIPKVTLTAGITPVNIRSDSYAGKPNPHAWMSPQLALIYIDNIQRALTDLDPSNSEIYAANAAAYKAKITDLDLALKETVSSLEANNRYLVSCEGAFSYLAKDYDLQDIYIWPVNAERQATPQQIQNVIDQVRTNQIPTVFCESTVSDRAQQQVVKETGAKFGGVFYVDSLSQPDGVVPTYLDLMTYNVNTLVNGLTAPNTE
jgi:manganese transport system substrate-binding protein